MPETAHQLALPLETHRNHYLFSDHYLNELLPRQAVWREAEAEAQKALEAITAKYHQCKLPNVDAYRNEPAQKIRQAWETSMETLRPLLARIEATDRLIDRIVYQLYGLTDEEIAVVEGR